MALAQPDPAFVSPSAADSTVPSASVVPEASTALPAATDSLRPMLEQPSDVVGTAYKRSAADRGTAVQG
jgi:hypothetical protein